MRKCCVLVVGIKTLIACNSHLFYSTVEMTSHNEKIGPFYVLLFSFRRSEIVVHNLFSRLIIALVLIPILGLRI